MDPLADRLSVKNLLFSKAIPNYVPALPTTGHKLYPCTDCGDKFLFETSLNDHVNRKSAKISYMCRYCNILTVFNNRCNLLSHIRSHAFKTATINVSDIKIEILPMTHFKTKPSAAQPSSTNTTTTTTKHTKTTLSWERKLYYQGKSQPVEIFCFECKANITVTGVAFKDRATHFMKFTNEVYSCPVCLFALPSICALKVHLRLHVGFLPFYCPECGVHLNNKNVQYPYNHDCEGFKMMRATARIKCTVPDCYIFHPNDYREHMSKYHLKKVYKCPFCVVACFNEATMTKHLKGHKSEAKPLLFFQCDVCPGRYVLQNPKLNDNHLKSHIDTTIFPCWACGSCFKEVSNLLTHFIKKHNKTDAIATALNAILSDNGITNISKPKRIYRVVKRCDQCKSSFTYKCKQEEIQHLPSVCPYKCSSNFEFKVIPEKSNDTSPSNNFITCHLCKHQISKDWEEIKKHYAKLHKSHKCLDAKISLTRVDFKKPLPQKKIAGITKAKLKTQKKGSSKTKGRQLPLRRFNGSDEESELYVCNKCGKHCKQKVGLQKHMRLHKDSSMAYQCLECGQNCADKPSFSNHLLVEHDITQPDEYIRNKECYNDPTLAQDTIVIPDESLNSQERENQCNICRDEFESPEELEKHFRVHGMASLTKNT